MFTSGSIASILTTKHNLSATGPGAFKAQAETQVCIYCHVPHGASPAQPLWNHSSTVQMFTPYNQSVSLTLKSNPGQPDGASKLCLGCHDGTIAVGSTVSGGVVSGLGGAISGVALIGTNLSTSHPVSFIYDNALTAQNGELVNPANLPAAVKLDNNAKLQCTACHDPHSDTNAKFLVMNNSGGALCSTCHNKNGWSAGIHKTAPAMNGAGCNACHKPHGAGAVPLLKKDQVSLCYDCHGAGGPGPVNIQDKFSGTSTFAGAGAAGSYTTSNSHHDVSASDQAYSGAKISCGNCHNPHTAKQKSGAAGNIESLIDPFNRGLIWTGGGAVDYNGSINNFCLSCHNGKFPPSVANPNQSIAPASPLININTTYQTDRHGAGTARPTANNLAPAVAALACTVCHNHHGSHYNDKAWNGNAYMLNDSVDGTTFADNGAEAGPPYNWPYKAPGFSMGTVQNVRINPNKINTAGDANNINSLCLACHSKTSGPAGNPHILSFSNCTGCHHHGNPLSAGGL